MTTADRQALPPLPAATTAQHISEDGAGYKHIITNSFYTAEQMQSYALAALVAVQEPTGGVEVQYPSSSEGTIRCTCDEYPHLDWCGRIDAEGMEFAFWNQREKRLGIKYVRPLTPEDVQAIFHYAGSDKAQLQAMIESLVDLAPDAPSRDTQEADARDGAPDAEKLLPHAYLFAKVAMVMPLFEEARDALCAITEPQRILHRISKTLADRMDVAGTYSLDDWQAATSTPTDPVKDARPDAQGAGRRVK